MRPGGSGCSGGSRPKSWNTVTRMGHDLRRRRGTEHEELTVKFTSVKSARLVQRTEIPTAGSCRRLGKPDTACLSPLRRHRHPGLEQKLLARQHA